MKQQPDNLNPRLLCEGSCAPKIHHLHHFVETRLRKGVSAEPFGDPTWDRIFACDMCDTERVYGAETY